MDGQHPNKYDPRPKRRKDKDNPYEIFTVGIGTDSPHYYIRFRDGISAEHCLEVKKELFDLFNRFELDDLSFLNEVDRHYDLSDQNEETLTAHALYKPAPVEDAIMQKLFYEKLHAAILALPETQKRRLILYYFNGFTFEQIARYEHCSVHSVYVAIERAKEKIKIFLNQV